MKYLVHTLILVVTGFMASGCTSAIRFTSDPTAGLAAAVPAATVTSGSSYGNYKANEPVDYVNENAEPLKEEEESFKTGKASYYGGVFDGRKTASGEIYDKSEFTAAHRTLPFGTKVLVRNLRNNRSVIVRINDRGPFIDNRVIDLSEAAAEEIGMIRAGVVEVELKILN